MTKRVPTFWGEYTYTNDRAGFLIVECSDPAYPVMAKWPVMFGSNQDHTALWNRVDKMIADLTAGRIDYRRCYP